MTIIMQYCLKYVLADYSLKVDVYGRLCSYNQRLHIFRTKVLCEMHIAEVENIVQLIENILIIKIRCPIYFTNYYN